MSIPPIPPPLEQLGNRAFSFYPPILNVERNEWKYQKATWSEVLVVNTASNQELWIPRRYLGEVSRVDEPVMIVGLVKELEYNAGAVWPYQRRVLEMPVAVNAGPRTLAVPSNEGPAAVVGIRVESGTESRIGRLIMTAMAVGIALCVLVVMVMREGVLRPRIVYTSKDQGFLELSGRDDYYSVVAKLGTPSSDRWQSETGEIQYRGLYYPQRGYTVILMGENRKQVTYIGALDENWRPVHMVDLRTGGNTRALLSGLTRF